MAYDSHPKFSPDGTHILYISDKDGSDDAYALNLETEEEIKFSGDENDEMVNAEWAPDGDYVIVARGRREYKLWLYHIDGGRGVKLVDPSSRIKAIDPAFSADGRYIYYSRRVSAWNYNAQFPQYSLGHTTGKPAKILPLFQNMDQHLHLQFRQMEIIWCMVADLKLKQG